jgi:hypothetical protein
MKKNDLWLIILICAACIIIMLPRLLSARFGLLDDGVLLSNSQLTLKDPGAIFTLYKGAGRFIPTALIYRGIIYYFSGLSALRWYLFSCLTLIATCLSLAFLCKKYGFGKLPILLSALFFLASPAFIENFYTLSKSEVPMLLFLSGALLSAASFKSSLNRRTKIMAVGFSFLLLLLCIGAKETMIVLPVLFLAWVGISRIFLGRAAEYKDWLHSDGILLIGSIIGCVIYWLFRNNLGIDEKTTYVAGYQLFDIDKLFFNFRSLLAWIARDYPYLLPISLAAVCLKSLRQEKIVFFTLRWAVWMGAMALILLPWNYLSYYLLPFSFGAAIFSGSILGKMLDLLRSHPILNSTGNPAAALPAQRVTHPRWLHILSLTAMLLFAPSAINAAAFATEQLTIDEGNWQLIQQVVKLGQNSRVIVNLPKSEEYSLEIRLFVNQILKRPDITIETYDPPIQPGNGKDIYFRQSGTATRACCKRPQYCSVGPMYQLSGGKCQPGFQDSLGSPDFGYGSSPVITLPESWRYDRIQRSPGHRRRQHGVWLGFFLLRPDEKVCCKGRGI